MELLGVQEPKKNILAVGDYLRADGPFEGRNDNFDPVSSSKERYGVKLNVETVFMLSVRLNLEIMATDQKGKKVLAPRQSPLSSAREGVSGFSFSSTFGHSAREVSKIVKAKNFRGSSIDSL
jgi:hypothetical protein